MANEAKLNKLKNLQARKELLFCRIQRLYDDSQKVDNPINLKNFKIRYESLEDTKTEFQTIIADINDISLQLDKEYVPDFLVLESLDELYCHIKWVAKDVFRVQQTIQSGSNNDKTPRLPKLQLPTFSGEIDEWPVFYELFISLVHDNDNLTSADKMQYLITSLTGNALKACSAIPATGPNYIVMLDTLINNYEDKRLLASNYLDKIFDFKPVQHQSATALHNFVVQFDASVRSLKGLELTDLADSILSYLALRKLDSETHKLFENTRRDSSLPTYAEIIEFVQEQAKICARSHSIKSHSSSNSKVSPPCTNSKAKVSHSFVSLQNSNNINCPICNNLHLISSCTKFLEVEPIERYQMVKNKQLCINCLGRHKIINCRSKSKCKYCGIKHHSLLHFSNKPENKNDSSHFINSHVVGTNTPNRSQNSPNSSAIQGGSNLEMYSTSMVPATSSNSRALSLCSTAVNRSFPLNSTVLLGTALVQLTDTSGIKHTARFLLDSASQRHIISVSCCKRLNLQISKTSSIVQGIGTCVNIVKGQVNIVIASRLNPSYRYPIVALVVDRIIDKLPLSRVDIKSISHISHLPLADDTFHISGEVDGIIGAELYSHLLGINHVVGPPNLPTALETSLGYVIMGSAPVITNSEIFSSFCTILDPHLDELVQRFWELEQIPPQSVQTPDDLQCEKMFKGTYKRKSSGRYMVALPFKDSPTLLGDSYLVALRRFHALERKFKQDSQYKSQYVQIINEYLAEGYLKRLMSDRNLVDSSYYIPHHGIFKADSSSTPLRIVMDAGAKSDSLYSLNDLLYNGPKLQADVLTLFLNFRLFEIALIADIRRMYLQIELIEDHWRFQRILWRYSEDEPVSVYELTTVTFGVKSSPYLALRTVQQLTEDEKVSYPLGSSVAKTNMYMDDLLVSVSSLEEATSLYHQMIDLFKSGGFELAKWAVSSKQLLDIIPNELRAPNIHNFETDILKFLGLQWQPNNDMFFFKFCTSSGGCSKRNILSLVPRIFDPCGFLSPVTLQLKLFIKRLWTYQLDWDEMPPEHFVKQWKQFESELPLLVDFRVPRHLGVFSASGSLLVGFCDACESSYGAMVYIRKNTYSEIRTNLICAKSKVSPLKTISIPRLELCAAHLLAKLIKFVVDTFQSRLLIEKIYALSDSTVALSWIQSSPHRWKVFVSNRVAKIQELIPVNSWYHVMGENNISNCLSRGLSPANFMANLDWIHGPNWLLGEEAAWPIRFLCNEVQTTAEQKVCSFVVIDYSLHPLYLLISRCSSWLKLLRVTVYVCRFLKLLPLRKGIIPEDLEFAEKTIICIVQHVHFADEIKAIEKGKSCSTSLSKLRPFVHNKLLRVGGRLRNSQLEYHSQHPVLLPKRDALVNLLISHYHKVNLHTGPNLVLSLLRQRYWILAGRSVVRNIIHKCNFCFKFSPKIQYPLMGDLPSCRVQQAKPFLQTGVDFAGPLNIILNRHRGVRSQKAYICLFVCLSTKAIHIELVSDLSTANFIQALKRFLGRRGLCSVIWSDRGSNFIGSKTYLKEIYDLVATQEFEQKVTNELTSRGIEWKFIPGHAPHFGGLWESNIKSVKTHLRKIVGNQLLTYEEMYTFLVQIEALLNSRPLCILSSDPTEPLALTPAHFLTLTPLDKFPAADLTHEKINRLDRYQLIDRMIQDFWKRWKVEYLHTLQTREKWNTSTNPIQIGTVVLLQQPNVPPLCWPLGRIIEIFPGRDGIVRVVTVKTKTGTYNRPVVKVCPLPTQ